VAFVALAAGATPPRPAPLSNAALGRAIDRYVEPLVAAGHLSGQLLVTRRGEIVVERAYGRANRELERRHHARDALQHRLDHQADDRGGGASPDRRTEDRLHRPDRALAARLPQG
jgi:CubicO group peptidase (beta-lactamase class C family)